MKVLFISSGNSKFGISPIIKNQGESLKKEGVEIDFYTIEGKGILGYLKNIPKIKLLSKENYDVFHVHYSLSAFAATLGVVFPLVVSLMGSDVNSGWFTTHLIRFFNKYFWSGLIVKSDDMKDKLGSDNLIIIPNGVNIEAFKEMDKDNCKLRLGWDNCKKNILFAANPQKKVKNYNLAEKAFRLISDDNLCFHSLNDVPNKEMVYYFNAADVVLLTSLWEGSPNVIKEAMACNIPIVSTDVGDVKEVIGKTEGCYISTFEPEDVAKKIKFALEFGKRTTGREDIKHLESSIIAKKIIEVYKSVLTNRN